MQAEMSIKILKDGTIKVITDGPVPEEHHQNAEEFLSFIADKAGGDRSTEKLKEHHHYHVDGTSHSHVHKH